jgi:uncharacterized protein
MVAEVENLHQVIKWFGDKGKPVIVALSGGVDSGVVALAAKKALGDDVIAVTANYNTLSYDELSSAKNVARELNISHRIVTYDELANPLFVKNDRWRCYHCRTELSSHLIEEARKLSANLIVDGTQIDDLRDVRPGIKALKEHGIRSPLVECGLNKKQIRAIALRFSLSVFNRPSNSCLASRIPVGMPVTYHSLKRIENSEIAVKAVFDVSQVRVRDHGDIARIEVPNEELKKFFDPAKLNILNIQIKKHGFKYVAIDIGGYSSGNLSILDNSRGIKKV